MARQAPYKLYGNVDDLMKQVVNENMGDSADSHRDMSIDFGWEEEADTSAGPSISTDELNSTELLTALQDMAEYTQADEGNEVYFGVEVESVPNSPGTLKFVTRVGQYGQDRTGAEDAMIFGVEYGNLEDPSLKFTAMKMRNAAYAVKYGISPAITEITTGEALTPFTRHETFVRGYDSSAYATGGKRIVGSRRPRWVFKGKLLDGPTGQYGKDFDFGDRVLVSYRNKKLKVRINQVTVKVSEDGRPDISAMCEVAGWSEI
jgi:hypothetical protein